jgi:multicomponent Na+:H+ antiporter subunit B
MLMGIFSLLAASLYVLLDAVDVAADRSRRGRRGVDHPDARGAGADDQRGEGARRQHNLLALVVVLITGGALIYGTMDMPNFADPEAPAHQHVAPRYVQDSVDEIGIPNMVTSVLASYRGLDTLGEVLVIFSAGVAVLLLLGAGTYRRRPRPPRKRLQ